MRQALISPVDLKICVQGHIKAHTLRSKLKFRGLQRDRRWKVGGVGLLRWDIQDSAPLGSYSNSGELDGRWHLQTNQRSIWQPKYHTIVWRAGGSEDSGELERNGSGEGTGFIEQLEPGDCIGVIARAMVGFARRFPVVPN